MRFLAFSCVAFCFSLNSLFLFSEYKLVSHTLVPSVLHVGSSVTAELVIEREKGDKPLTLPAVLPQRYSLLWDSDRPCDIFDLTPLRQEIVLHFKAYAFPVFSFPSVNFGPYVLPASSLLIRVAPLVPDSAQIRPVEYPALSLYSRLTIVLLGLILAVIVFMIYLSWYFFVRSASLWRARLLRRRARYMFRRSLARMIRSPRFQKKYESLPAYTQLDHAIRGFLTSFFEDPRYESLVPASLLGGGSLALGAPFLAELATILERAQVARFAGGSISFFQYSRDIRYAIFLARSVL